MDPQQPQQVQIRAENDDIKGHYSNIAQIFHTKEEVIIDFLLQAPSGVSLISRIIMSPGHAKRLSIALNDNIGQYEKQFGEIKEAEQPKTEIGFTS
jgi:3-dehydroquinate dehydratase